jgi:FkbM family methyltransferase
MNTPAQRTPRQTHGGSSAGKEAAMKPIPMQRVLRGQRFHVSEVIDVGVHAGTRWLNVSFPDARFVLVDPIPDCEGLLQYRPRKYEFVNCGLGAAPGNLTLNRYSNEKLDSFLDTNPADNRQLVERVDVPVSTLDDIIERHCTSDHIGVKIDTEGFELEVIRGLNRHKERVVFIIAEAAVIDRHVDSYQYSDLVAELRDKNFYFLNSMNPQEVTKKFHDVIFVQREDPRLRTPVHKLQDLESQDRVARERVLSRRS